MLHERFGEVVAKVEELLNSPKLMVFGRIDAWLKAGAEPEIDIYPVLTKINAQGRWNGSTLSYFDGPVAQSLADRTKPLPVVEARAPRQSFGKVDSVYVSPPVQSDEDRDRIDKGRAEMIMRGINVMSVTSQDARRMKARGWLSPEAAERFGA